ncbi:hypothetical protein [Alcanivorax sp. 1008]|uniref:hypothetical protein n=1 Tax=Alcanivorax sp. 1008 TaxID=2816853 RepID=UPI001DDA9B6F|nr:hypothetical protein [Alcanivorax sp. 1008]MCC1498039.1 hypothetical protein [Alcanivorax sp. 1008]
MKLRVFSDIHVEVSPDRPLQTPGPEADLMVFSVDTGEGPGGITLSAEQSQRRGKSSLWLYGHTHASSDHNPDCTRVISNQLGYPGERNQGFDANMVIEI